MQNSVMRSTQPSSKGRPSFLPMNSFASEKSFLVFDDPIPEGEVYASDKIPAVRKDDEEHELYLYLIRHGEAEHNIKEKQAMADARRSCLLEGLQEDHPETQKRMECARKAALNDMTLKDAHLSTQGRREAEEARDKLHKLITENNLPSPNYIFVSPLTRTLETCDIMFPGHKDIHVREALTERRTGKPPDTRSSFSNLIMRPEFQHFSMEQLRGQSVGEKRQVAPKETREKEIFIMGAHDTWEKFEQQNFANFLRRTK